MKDDSQIANKVVNGGKFGSQEGKKIRAVRGRAVEDGKEVFARELDEGRKVFVELFRTKNIQTRVVGRALAAFKMDVNSMESVGKDVIKTRTEEGSVFVVRTDGESMEVQREDEARAGMEKEFLLPLGWMASLERCT